MISTATIISKLQPVIDWLTKGFTKKFLNQPELTIILTRAGGGKSPLGFVKDTIQPDGSMLVTVDSTQISNVHTSFAMTIRNNSEHQAYHIDLLSPKPDNVWVQLEPKKIDFFKPIAVNTEQVYKWTISKIFTGTGYDAADLAVKGLDYFLKNKIVLEYTNVKKTKFYTVFDYTKTEKERNEFFRMNPLHTKS